MAEEKSMIVGAAGLGVVGVCTAPALISIYKRFGGKKAYGYQNGNALYQDEDGTATEKSQQEFSTIIPRSVALIAALGGLLVSTATSVLRTRSPEDTLAMESWLAFGSWALLVIQALNLFSVRDPIARYGLGVWSFLSALVIIIVISVENGLLRSSISELDKYTIHIVITVAQVTLALVSLLSSVAIQRRPEIYRDGRPVNGEHTVSAFGKITFAWSNAVLTFARKNKSLSLDELPVLSHYVMSDYLQKRFNQTKGQSKLWKLCFYNFRWVLVGQLIMVIAIGISQFGPAYAMYNLLKLLEQREEGERVAITAWAWVFGLGLTMIVASLIESWLYYSVWADLGIPMRAMLSSLVFMKATRRKDVKGVSKAKDKTAADASSIGGPVVNISAGPHGEDTAPVANKDSDEDEDENMQKTRQSTINLVGVDTKRVADFCSFAFLFPGAVIKLLVSMTFLNTLIGWKALLAGLVTFALSIPFNTWVSKGYNRAQGDLMKLRDLKMAVVTEALQGIRQIKFSALERQWQEKIGQKRSQELSTQWSVFKFDTGIVACWIFGPIMLSAMSLATYAYLNGDLTSSIAFTTIAVLSTIEVTLAAVPEMITDALDCWVSINRIDDYLNAPEKVDCTIPGDSIAFENVSIAWPSDSQEDDPDRFVLRDINIRFPRQELSVISGKTGSGKSLLLAAILGEVDKISGTIRVPKAPSLMERFDHKATKGNWIIDSSIAFVAQIPWIENATIKDNILFGLPFDAGRYNTVKRVCALEKDLEILPDGELTDIGANGINLSGGQRWRVSFARALYSRAGILVLDDIFSAVDAHVGRQLFEDALTGELGTGRTRILVTHHVGLCLPKTKYTIQLGEGTVEHAGFIEALQRTGSLAKILSLEERPDGEEQDDIEESVLKVEEDGANALSKVFSHRSTNSAKIDDGCIDTKGQGQPKKFVEDEKREQGKIKFAVYKEYLKTSGGWLTWVVVAAGWMTYVWMMLFRSWWVSIWTRSYETEASSVLNHSYLNPTLQVYLTPEPLQKGSENIWYYLGIYVALSVGLVVLGASMHLFVLLASLRASRILFQKLLYTVLRAPLRWLDTVPLGRILNRFTADFNAIDSRIANTVGFFLSRFLQMIAITITGFIVSPYIIIFAVFLLSMATSIALRFLGGAREVKRLESNAKSPIFEQFGSALAGVGTIRAFDKTEEYIQRMFEKVDAHASAFWHIWLFNRWMSLRLNIIGASFAIVIAALVVASKTIDASLAGFALSFALQYTSAIIWTLRSYAGLEMEMNATERVIEYTGIPIEDQTGSSPPAAWPTEGRLEVHDLVAGYAPELPPVLKGLSFTIEKNQRVGVVGRTGAGKSSLTLALFRFLSAREGQILIDGIDISQINLHDLRSRLAIIPQDPVLFSGTVRSNLDAFNEHTDAELRDALERVHLIRNTGLASRDEVVAESSASGSAATATATDTNTNIFQSLGSKISEGGLNLSQGQRQLLCLARAIVSRPKIMVLDEATSAVDMATDVLIQRSIREEFGDSTLLVIAHRLSTIADFDKILVMSEGRAVEFESPRELLRRRGVFCEMVGQSGERERLEEIIWGEGGSEGSGSRSGSSGQGSASGSG